MNAIGRFARPSHLAVYALALLAAVACSCSHRAKIIQPQSSIDYATFSSASLAVGGITTILGPPEERPARRDEFSTMLESVLMAERGDLSIMPAGEVRGVVGDEAYDTMLQRFESTGNLDAETLGRADSTLRARARYLLMGRIKEATVSRRESESDADDDPKTDTKKYERKTSLKVRAGFRVFDMQSRSQVWSADVEQHGSNSTTETGSSNGILDLIGSIFGASKGNEEDYPPPPSLESVLPMVFEGLAENLPTPPKKK
jgi:hypothetical protein